MNTAPRYLTTADEHAEWAALVAAQQADPDSMRLWLLVETLANDPEGMGTITENARGEYPALVRAACRGAVAARARRGA